MGRFLQTFLFAFALVAVGAGIGASQGHAQQQEQPAQPSASADTSNVAQMVLSKMHQANQMEMQAGQLAREKGSTARIRRYGARIFRDHRFGDSKVTSLAEEKGIQVVEPKPQAPDEKKQMQRMQQMMQKLKGAEGRQFDQAYLQMMVKSHENSIQMLSQATAKLQDADVRRLVERLIPILEQHYTLAGHLQEGSSTEESQRQENQGGNND